MTHWTQTELGEDLGEYSPYLIIDRLRVALRACVTARDEANTAWAVRVLELELAVLPFATLAERAGPETIDGTIFTVGFADLRRALATLEATR